MHASGNILLGTVAGLLAMLSVTAPATAQAQAGRAIRCESTDGHFNRCAVPWKPNSTYFTSITTAPAASRSAAGSVRNTAFGVPAAAQITS